jgi:protein-S-isoprenylcysteine O-methyltransferase Ste14
MEIALTVLGLGIAGATFVAIIWSIAFPARRLWPPCRYTRWTPILVWVPTFTLFGVLLALGVLGWRQIEFPQRVRIGLGVPLIVLGNVAVWIEVLRFGIPQTGGEVGSLKTDSFYQYSRNPQYVADTAMIVGWMLLTAAPMIFLVGAAAILVLLIAPLAEEPWLRKAYGLSYEQYRGHVRRFL